MVRIFFVRNEQLFNKSFIVQPTRTFWKIFGKVVVLYLKSNTPFRGPIQLWMDLELTNQTACLCVDIQ